MATVVSSTLAYKPFFLQKDVGASDPIYYSASDFRRMLTGLFPRTGILGSSHFLITQADNVGMAIKVNAGYAVVGRYLVHSAETQTIDLSGFSGSPAATRTHKVFLSVYDALTAGSDYAAKVEVVEDTGAGANPPGNAANYLQLGTLSVGPNQGNIQNKNIANTVRHGGNAGEYVMLDGYLDALFTTAGTDTDGADFRALYTNGFVRLSGAIKRADGKAFANGANYNIGVMHSNLRPARTVFLSGACSVYDSPSDNTGSYHWRLAINKDGLMTAFLPTGTGPRYLNFDGMSYDLD